MKIYFRGKNDKVSREEFRYALKWMSNMLMSNQMIKRLKITVESKQEYGLKGSCQYENYDTRHPREFTICIDPYLSRRNQLVTLAHELVHVKQFAYGEMKDTKYYDMVKWNKQFINHEETDYWDLPWEIEAAGREYGLYRRYVDHLHEERIRF